MPHVNGFEFCEKILAIDAYINVKICFMSSCEREGLREIYTTRQEGCFVRKPISIDYLIKRIRSEVDQAFDDEIILIVGIYGCAYIFSVSTIIQIRLEHGSKSSMGPRENVGFLNLTRVISAKPGCFYHLGTV